MLHREELLAAAAATTTTAARHRRKHTVVSSTQLCSQLRQQQCQLILRPNTALFLFPVTVFVVEPSRGVAC